MAKPNERDRYKYGICINRDKDGDGKSCSKCESKEVQKLRIGQDFECEECKEPLRQVPPPAAPTNTKLIAAIVAGIVVVGGGAYFGFSGGKAADEVVVIDSVVTAPAEVATTDTEAASVIATEPKSESTAAGGESATSGTPKVNLGYAVYEGPVSGGKPDGIGVLYIKNSHSIDLKKANGEMLEVGSGDKIMNAKFSNGDLRQGELNRKDGTRKTFHIG